MFGRDLRPLPNINPAMIPRLLRRVMWLFRPEGMLAKPYPQQGRGLKPQWSKDQLNFGNIQKPKFLFV
jgi:hypothetical protein